MIKDVAAQLQSTKLASGERVGVIVSLQPVHASTQEFTLLDCGHNLDYFGYQYSLLASTSYLGGCTTDDARLERKEGFERSRILSNAARYLRCMPGVGQPSRWSLWGD